MPMTDGLPDPLTLSWQWSLANSNGGTYTAITATTENGANTATFTPDQPQANRFLQVCASFTDSAGNSEELCHQIATRVANVNDPPNPGFTIGFAFDSPPLTGAPKQGASISLGTFGINDPDGVSDLNSARWFWSSDDGGNGIFTAIGSGDLVGLNQPSFVPSQKFVGDAIRCCVTYTDDFGAMEEACATTLPVVNANDAPVAQPGRVAVPVNATSTAPYPFKPTDFPFTDEDGDALAKVQITALPTDGTMARNGTALTSGDLPVTLTVAQLGDGNLTYYPTASNAAVTTGNSLSSGFYAQFSFKVEDDGSDGEDDKVSVDAAKINIRLVSTSPAAAGGAPAITGTVAQGQTLRAAYTDATSRIISDPNGIDESTIRWQWQLGAAADGDFASVEGATDAAFALSQAQVGMHIRVCVFFTDGLGNKEGGTAAAPTLCSTAARVANINDAPVAQSSTIRAFTTADMESPFVFAVDDFIFTDADGDSLASVTLVSLPDEGTLHNGTGAAAVDDIIMAADMDDLQYWPESGQSAQTGYASFTFHVTDDGGDGSGDMTSTEAATMTIDLIPPGPRPAIGQPTATGTAAEDETLSAARGTVRDDNGINESTIMWQWQQAAPADGAAPADDSAAWSNIADPAAAATLQLDQPQVAQYVRACMIFMDEHSTPASERRCSAAIGPVGNVNDAPVAENTTYQAARDGNSNTVAIPVSAFAAAFMDADPDDSLAAVTITGLPDENHGTLRLGTGTAATAVTTTGTSPNNVLAITGGEFDDGPLTFTITAASLQQTTLMFTLSDGELSSGAPAMDGGMATSATLTITFGKDIEEEQVNQVSAILSVAAVTNAANAIGGAIGAAPTPSAFDISLDGTSLMGAAQTLGRGAAAPLQQNAWYHSTTAEWEYMAAYNAGDDSAESLLHRLRSMAAGDIAMNWQAGGSAMRFWARYQSIDISGNEGEMLEYDGSGTGFYLGADRRINERMRLGLAISSDNADMTIDIDEDETDDDASRSATTIYPYLHIDLGGNNQARVIAGFGSGTLDIKSSASSNSTASADLSWNMLAASISHHRPMRGNLSARFDGSLQLGNSSTDETTFDNGSALAAADTSTNEIAIDAQLRYQSGNFIPHASLTARKLGGDLSQALAMDLGLGADLQTGAAIIRLGITRQINDTIHQRHSLSLDIATRPNPGGLSASLGSRYDSIMGKAQWQGAVRWRRKAAELSLAASPGDLRLQGRLRW